MNLNEDRLIPLAKIYPRAFDDISFWQDIFRGYMKIGHQRTMGVFCAEPLEMGVRPKILYGNA